MEAQAWGFLGTGQQGLASNIHGEAGQNTERALLDTRDEAEADDEASLLLSRIHLCVFGEPSGDLLLQSRVHLCVFGEPSGDLLLLLSRPHLCVLGEAGGDGVLKEYEVDDVAAAGPGCWSLCLLVALFGLACLLWLTGGGVGSLRVAGGVEGGVGCCCFRCSTGGLGSLRWAAVTRLLLGFTTGGVVGSIRTRLDFDFAAVV